MKNMVNQYYDKVSLPIFFYFLLAFFELFWPYSKFPQGDAISYSKNETEWNLGGKPVRNMVIVDVYTTWTILIGIFFPSVTGAKTAMLRKLNAKSSLMFFSITNPKQ